MLREKYKDLVDYYDKLYQAAVKTYERHLYFKTQKKYLISNYLNDQAEISQCIDFIKEQIFFYSRLFRYIKKRLFV